ncbi:MAG: hypothetical protein ABI479_02080 [Gallionella sp.]
MKRILMLLSISCALGLLSFQAYCGDERKSAPEVKPNCSKHTNAKSRTYCEQVNRLIDAACGGKTGDALVKCQKAELRKHY